MQNIEQLNDELFQLYKDVKDGKESIRKGMALANIANTLLRGIVVQVTMTPLESDIKRLNL